MADPWPRLTTSLSIACSSAVAEAPKNIARKVQTMRELDTESKYSVPSAAAGVDLTLLTTALSPANAVAEEDDEWEFDALLQSVAQDIQADIDADEEAAKAF